MRHSNDPNAPVLSDDGPVVQASVCHPVTLEGVVTALRQFNPSAGLKGVSSEFIAADDLPGALDAGLGSAGITQVSWSVAGESLSVHWRVAKRFPLVPGVEPSCAQLVAECQFQTGTWKRDSTGGWVVTIKGDSHVPVVDDVQEQDLARACWDRFQAASFEARQELVLLDDAFQQLGADAGVTRAQTMTLCPVLADPLTRDEGHLR